MDLIIFHNPMEMGNVAHGLVLLLDSCMCFICDIPLAQQINNLNLYTYYCLATHSCVHQIHDKVPSFAGQSKKS